MEGNLEERIELLREKMMNAANTRGLTDAETVEFSRMLDNLMDQYGGQKKSDNGLLEDGSSEEGSYSKKNSID